MPAEGLDLRKAAPSERSAALLFARMQVDQDSVLSLQAQIRRHLVRLIVAGDLPPGSRLPGSRRLAASLGVSRNTVAIAYQQLISEGLIIGRERSGLFVSEDLVSENVVPLDMAPPAKGRPSGISWKSRLERTHRRPAGFRCPPDWRRHPYPFLDGRFDASLYLINEWREAARLALGVGEILQWSIDAGEADDSFLIEEIRTKILPRRGIHARPQEILITAGAQQALFCLSQILVESSTRAALEEPGSADLRQMVTARGGALAMQPVDDEGLVVDANLDGCGIVFVTPGHQVPTGATLSLERRHALLAKARKQDMLIVENDVNYESSYGERALPALHALDRDGRVIYVANLSKLFGPALRLGFMVGPPELLDEVRELRRLMMRHPPLHNQRTAAFFLSLGHYDANMLKISRVCRQRGAALVDALDYYLPHTVALQAAPGGTSFFIRGPADLDVNLLASEAAKRGVLIEPADSYFSDQEVSRNVFRMGVTSLPAEKIRPGVETLAGVIRDLTRDKIELLDNAVGRRLRHDDLTEVLGNMTFLCRTVQGEPYSFQLFPDGTMVGQAGYANEDRDTGKWWIDGDRWFRRWTRWSYAEAKGFDVVIDKDQVKWFNAAGKLVDRAVVAPAEAVDDQVMAELDS